MSTWQAETGKTDDNDEDSTRLGSNEHEILTSILLHGGYSISSWDKWRRL